MAILSHFPNIFSFSLHKPLISHNLTPIQPVKRFIVSASSSLSKSRVRKNVKSNEDLCIELREFVSSVGFPQGHVPSMKELSLHGRKDLANIVRRRGYKVIRELLEEKSIAENQDTPNGCEDELTGQDEKVDDLSKVISLVSNEIAIMEDISDTETSNPVVISDDKRGVNTESSPNLSLQEKVENFIQNGELDTIEGEYYGSPTDSGGEEGQGVIETEHLELNPRGTKVATILNGSAFGSNHAGPHATANHLLKDDYTFSKSVEQIRADTDEDLDVETIKKKNEAEIEHLRLMLHQKELELSELKEKIEKEKHALSILQTKAETEINEAQKLVSEKDEELHAAEESVLGLEEVQIQFRGEGDMVEMAGSFNGWTDPIKMNPHPPSGAAGSAVSRKTKLWSAPLWLYPGIYEIKFIVDGQWRVDPEMESITSGTIQNNILRVGR